MHQQGAAAAAAWTPLSCCLSRAHLDVEDEACAGDDEGERQRGAHHILNHRLRHPGRTVPARPPHPAGACEQVRPALSDSVARSVRSRPASSGPSGCRIASEGGM